MITLYRPYLSTTLGRQENDLVSEEARAVLRNVSSDCIAAARHVTDYLRCYQRQHTFTRSNIQVVHITFTASLIFIYDICSQTNQQSWASQRDLQFCTDILGQLGRCFGNAHRALEVIILIKHQWWQMSAARRARTQAAKRDSGNMSGGDSWGDEELKTGGGSLRDSMDRSKRRYSPAVPEAAQQSFANPPSSSPFQPFEQYPQQGAFHLDFGIEQQTPLENSHNLFMDETELYFNDMSGRMEWFDQAQFYPPDGSTNSHGTR